MPPKKGRRPSRPSIGRASELMGPPPAPGAAQQTPQDVRPEPGPVEDPLSQKIFGPEVKAMKERLIDSATIIAQLVNHHTDVHKVLVDSYAWFYVFSLTDSASGVQQQVPNPPRALRDAWLRQSELYEELIDTIEIQLRRALAAVDYQIEQEQEKFKRKAEAEELQRSGTTAGRKARRHSLFIDIPRFDETSIDPLTIHPDINLKASVGDGGDTEMQDSTVLTEEPGSVLDGTQDDGPSKIPSGPVVPKDPGILRPSRSSISLTSLNRHGPKLDLSNVTMDIRNESMSALPTESLASGLGGITGIKAIASPVTLAPKSARPLSEFDPLNVFLASATEITIDDLFGDGEMPFVDSAGGDSTVGGAGAAAAIESFLSVENLLPKVKTEDSSIDLLGPPGTHADPSSATVGQDNLFEELGLVEVKSDHAPMISTSATGVDMGADLSSLGGDNIGMTIGPFEFPNPSVTTDAPNFDMMALETPGPDVQQMQQQHQPFGIDLGLPPTSDTGGVGQVDSKMLDPYQQLLGGSAVGSGTSAADLGEFNFLFSATGDGNSTLAGADEDLNFDSLFEDATGGGNGKSG